MASNKLVSLKVKQIHSGDGHVCAILHDSQSSAICWGLNDFSQCGYGEQFGPPAPRKVIYFQNELKPVQIRTGALHTCAIMNDKSLQCWGSNLSNQLGIPEVVGIQYIPATVKFADQEPILVRDVALGSFHTCAVPEIGETLYCFGANDSGQLGVYSEGQDLTIPFKDSSIKFPDGKFIVKIDCGSYHTCVLMNDGTIYCFGYNGYGQLGDGSSNDRYSIGNPVSFRNGTPLKASVISTGYYHTCAILSSDHTIRCWGGNEDLQSGIDTAGIDILRPPNGAITFPNGTAIRAKDLSAGLHTCATLLDDSVHCFGWKFRGALGDGQVQDGGSLPKPIPVRSAETNDTLYVKQLTTGASFTCVVVYDDTIRCFGSNEHGQIDGFRGSPISPPLNQPLRFNLSFLEFTSSPVTLEPTTFAPTTLQPTPTNTKEPTTTLQPTPTNTKEPTTTLQPTPTNTKEPTTTITTITTLTPTSRMTITTNTSENLPTSNGNGNGESSNALSIALGVTIPLLFLLCLVILMIFKRNPKAVPMSKKKHEILADMEKQTIKQNQAEETVEENEEEGKITLI